MEQNCVINSLASIKEFKVKQLIINNNKLVINWENIYNYYDGLESGEFDDVIINLLNDKDNYDKLAVMSLETGIKRNEDYIDKFSIKLINCDELEIDSYKNLMKCITYSYDSIPFEKLEIDKIESLIENGILTLSQENFEGLKVFNKNLQIKLIEVNQFQFINIFSEFSLVNLDWIYIMGSKFITNESKIAFIKVMDENIIIKNQYISARVLDVLNVNEYIPLSFNLMEALFKVDGNTSKKIDLLNLQFNKLDKNQVKSLIEKLDGGYKNALKLQHKPTFTDSPQNRALFENLQNRNLVRSFSTTKKGDKIKVIALYS